jgi:DNA polymerase bacteriophage-type
VSDAAHIDFEWGSPVNLRKAGVHRTLEHPAARIHCMSWRIGDTGPVNSWWPGQPDPQPLLDHVAAGRTVISHNAVAERTGWALVRRKYCPHWPPLRIEQQDCTMARCATLAIPQSLEIAAMVLGTSAKKDMEGNAIMRRWAMPAKVTPTGEYIWHDSPGEHYKIIRYCDQDVETETEVDIAVPPLSPFEREVWELDQWINERGVLFDVPAIQHCIEVREIAKAKLNAAMARITNGVVQKCSQTKALLDWIKSLGIECTSVAKSEHERLLADADDALGDDDGMEIVVEGAAPNAVAQALAVRAEANKTSTAKYTAMLNCVCADGRARGLLAYHGTNTGRWAGRLIQPHNLYRVDPERDGHDIEIAVEVMHEFYGNSAHDMLTLLFGSAMSMLAKMLRSMIIAQPGCTLKGADLSNIEGRLAAWLAGEQWKLDAFAAYDAGEGPDLYIVAYGRSFGVELASVTKSQRQIGKVEELALGYQGGVGSFISMGKVYGLKPAGLVEPVRAASPEDFEATRLLYRGARDKFGLPEDQWAAVKVVVKGWRAAHPQLVQGWWDLQDAAIAAVENPGTVEWVYNGRVCYMSDRSFLYCRLPSGRLIYYCRPYLTTVTEEWVAMPDGSRHHGEDFDKAAWPEIVRALALQGGEYKQRTRKQVTYEGYEGSTKRWTRFGLYGGMQFNHIIQGTARDVLVGGMMRAERRGYRIVLHVHDEALDESPAGFGSGEELAAIMSEGEPWLEGCPLSAKGWEGPRYSK